MARALVTGATGFIGGHLVRDLLKRDIQVRALVRRASAGEALRSLGVEVVVGDVTRSESLQGVLDGVDTVYHQAGTIKAFTPAEFQRVNEHGVRNLLEACAAQRQPPVVVHTSSIAAAGPSPADSPRTEDDPLAPVSYYGHSKRAGEVVCEQYADRVPITIVRPPIVFGEGDLAMLSLFRPVNKIGLFTVPGWAIRRVSLLYVRDLTAALMSCAERGVRVRPHTTQGVYFLADDARPTYAELGRLIGDALGRQRLLVVRIPDPLAWCVGATAEVVSRIRRQPGMVNLDKIREAVAGSWICSATRAREQLGFSVTASLQERMRQTAESYHRLGWVA